jgi:hypothetical protein
MDDQRDDILVHRSRTELDRDAACFEFERPGIRPIDVVSKPPLAYPRAAPALVAARSGDDRHGGLVLSEA